MLAAIVAVDKLARMSITLERHVLWGCRYCALFSSHRAFEYMKLMHDFSRNHTVIQCGDDDGDNSTLATTESFPVQKKSNCAQCTHRCLRFVASIWNCFSVRSSDGERTKSNYYCSCVMFMCVCVRKTGSINFKRIRIFLFFCRRLFSALPFSSAFICRRQFTD